MTDADTAAATRVRQAAAELKRLRPTFSELLGVYEQIFLAQEACLPNLRLGPVVLDPSVLAAKRKGRLPLIDPIEFPWDPPTCRSVLEQVCRVAADSSSTMAPAAAVLSWVLSGHAAAADPLFKAMLAADTAVIKQAADSHAVDIQALLVLVYNGLKPCLVHTAAQLATHLEKDVAWDVGNCPVCGNPPGMSTLDHQGRRHLHCRFCWHAWPVSNLFCPGCGNTLPGDRQYFYSRKEPEYRLDVCKRCQRYLKSVDLQRTERTIYLALEQAASLHLDLVAAERGFKSAAESKGLGNRTAGPPH